MIERHGFGTITYKGGVKTPEEEIETLRALRAAFPAVKLRYDPQAIYSPATSIRIGKKIEALDLEYYEDPCWGHDGMARVRQRVDIPWPPACASSIWTAWRSALAWAPSM
jgi:glucarate dehydratase